MNDAFLMNLLNRDDDLIRNVFNYLFIGFFIAN